MKARGGPSSPSEVGGPSRPPVGTARRVRTQAQQQQQQQQHQHDEATDALLPLVLLLRDRASHRNVSLMLYFRVLNAISYAARSASIFDAYLHMQFGGNRAIGAMASLTGLITVVVAPLAGWGADALKARRCLALKAAAAWGLVCICVNYAAIGLSSFNLLLASNLMWKAWYECVTVLTESLFNDAIPPGERSQLFVLRRILTTLANGLGPLLSLCVFLVSENVWRADVLHRVLKVGVFLSIPQLIVLLFWREITDEEALLIRMRGSKPTTPQEQQQQEKGEAAAAECGSRKHLFFLKTRHVPWLIFHWQTAAGLVSVVAVAAAGLCLFSCFSGMTVKYFPLFFKSEYGFQPIHSCLLSTAYTLSIAALTYVIQLFAARMGPTKASFLFTSIGVCGLFLLSQVYWLPAVLVIYLLRGAFQNASTPLDRSVCLDLIPTSLVGRWAALQSLATLMWSVSALFGGFLADYTDYRQIFIFTGRIYVVAQLVYLPCLWLLPHTGGKPQKLRAETLPGDKPSLSPTTSS
ncbi:hypothetical protein Esti_004004 [Eimeria stiedai]